jgi:hypothetical protein
VLKCKGSKIDSTVTVALLLVERDIGRLFRYFPSYLISISEIVRSRRRCLIFCEKGFVSIVVSEND